MIKSGDHVFVPFWVLQEYLDASPPDPFVYCKVLKTYATGVVGNNDLAVDICDLEIKQNLEAPAIPISYLIKPDEIEEWANKIGEWFLEFPKRTRC